MLTTPNFRYSRPSELFGRHCGPQCFPKNLVYYMRYLVVCMYMSQRALGKRHTFLPQFYLSPDPQISVSSQKGKIYEQNSVLFQK